MYVSAEHAVCFWCENGKWFSLEEGYDEPISSDLEVNSVN
jgi:hypothetical protein